MTDNKIGIAVGLGLIGFLAFISFDTGVNAKPTPKPIDKPKTEPKKILL